MGISDQFAGLKMDQLIGAPLSAAADASIQMANSTADFINRVGFDGNGNIRTASFGYQKRSLNNDGTSNLDEMKVEVPILAIVPIPNLQVDEVNVLFDMEVKQSEKEESNLDLGGSITGSLNLGIVKVSVTGNVSAHQSNTRSSDNSAKYHVDVRATNHGTPEGLARVLDMMAANVAPTLVNSSIQDGNGQALPEKEKNKAEKLKTLRAEISQIEARLSSAKNELENQINQLKKVGTTQLNVYQSTILKLMNDLNKDNPDDNAKATTYSQHMDTVNQTWNAFRNQVQDTITLIVDSGEATSEEISKLFSLDAIDATGEVIDYANTESYYKNLVAAQNSAIKYQISVNSITQELSDKKSEYNDTMAGIEKDSSSATVNRARNDRTFTSNVPSTITNAIPNINKSDE